MLMSHTLVFAAEETQPVTESEVQTETEPPQTETKAPETQAPETQPPQTETETPETQSPETQPPQTETKAHRLLQKHRRKLRHRQNRYRIRLYISQMVQE